MPVKTFLTSDEISQMVEQAVYLRDKVIIAFYADTGCRVSELLKLRVENLDLKKGLVLIRHLKRGTKKRCPVCNRMAGRNTPFCSKCGMDLGNIVTEGIEERSRLISIGTDTVDLLKLWIKNKKPEELLVNITRQQVYNIVRAAAASIGLEGKVMINPDSGKAHYAHPHSFRDSLAVDWLNLAGGDASKQKALQDHLGHRNFETTMTYNKLTPTRVQEIGNEVRNARFKK